MSGHIDGGASLNILYVEDHADTRLAVTRLLARMGHQAMAVGTLQEARSALTSSPFDVVLVDIGLPDGDGESLVPSVRSARPAARVVAVTGFGDGDNRKLIGRAGFDDFVLKPFSIEKLLKAVCGDLARPDTVGEAEQA
jgi:DNA-binding response OmpR family regulator